MMRSIVFTAPVVCRVPSTTYWYRARAFSGSGYSTYSNEASDTTTAFAGIWLTATGSKTKGWQNVELTWDDTAAVDIYRNNVLEVSGIFGGLYLDANIAKGGASYTYQVCSAGSTSNCSNEALVVF